MDLCTPVESRLGSGTPEVMTPWSHTLTSLRRFFRMRDVSGVVFQVQGLVRSSTRATRVGRQRLSGSRDTERTMVGQAPKWIARPSKQDGGGSCLHLQVCYDVDLRRSFLLSHCEESAAHAWHAASVAQRSLVAPQSTENKLQDTRRAVLFLEFVSCAAIYSQGSDVSQRLALSLVQYTCWILFCEPQ